MRIVIGFVLWVISDITVMFFNLNKANFIYINDLYGYFVRGLVLGIYNCMEEI